MTSHHSNTNTADNIKIKNSQLLLKIQLINIGWFIYPINLTLYLIETPFNVFANRADPDQAVLVRADPTLLIIPCVQKPPFTS